MFPEAGQGMQWDHPSLEIEVNDIVVWQWAAPSHIANAKYTVLQAENAYHDANGTGFGNLKSTSEGMH